MMSEWKKVSVSDLGRIVTGKTPKTAISEYYGGCIPFLTPSDDMSVKYVLSTSKTITEDGKNSVKNAVIPKNSICVSCIGSDLGKVVITTKETVTNQQINSVIVNTELYDVDFVYYAMVILGKVLNYHSKTSTAVPIVNKSTFSQYEILCPVLSEQRKIARILSEIDSKIAINTAINENLEQQAQALFKAWFVDFEPFGGVMPDDWAVTTLGTIAAISTKSINPLKQPDLYLEHYSIPAYDEQHYPVFEYASEVKSNKYILTNNSVMISKLNPDTKRIWRPLCLSANPVCSTEFIVYEAVNPKYKDYIYSLIDSQAFSDYLCAHTTGSTNSRQRATPNATLDYTCIMPSDDIITRFCGIVTPMYDQIASNIIESQRLAALRDTLLPKLMNGEIDVSAVKI